MSIQFTNPTVCIFKHPKYSYTEKNSISTTISNDSRLISKFSDSVDTVISLPI